MAFDITKPAGNDSVGSSAPYIRENFRALLQDKFTQGSTTPSSATGIDGYLFFNTTEKILYEKINGVWTAIVAVDVPDATASTKGKMKLYTSTGNSTDGTMTRNAITSALSGKLDTNGNAATASYASSAGSVAWSNVSGRPVYLKTTYVSGASGYNIWSNGYCEQWGQTSSSRGNSTRTIYLSKTFSDTNYNVICTGGAGGASTDKQHNSFQWVEKGTSYFTAVANCVESIIMSWKVSGYLASGQY